MEKATSVSGTFLMRTAVAMSIVCKFWDFFSCISESITMPATRYESLTKNGFRFAANMREGVGAAHKCPAEGRGGWGES